MYFVKDKNEKVGKIYIQVIRRNIIIFYEYFVIS